jgi:N-hydroxyarylamine O-acetyltransferase
MPYFNLDQYLERIQLNGAPSVDIEGLMAIVCAQHNAIPFENFDIQLGRPIFLDEKNLCNKLIKRQRGGYCFELNGLLRTALTTIGFEVTPRLARIHLRGPHNGRTHLLLEINIQGQRWIADVGFGASSSLSAPALLEEDCVFTQSGFDFRYIQDEKYGWMFQYKQMDDTNNQNNSEYWQAIYSFDNSVVEDGDIALANFYTSHTPDLFFTDSRIAAKPIESGRVSLLNYELSLLENGHKTVTLLEDNTSYLDTLKQVFGIELDADYSELKAVPKAIPI